MKLSKSERAYLAAHVPAAARQGRQGGQPDVRMLAGVASWRRLTWDGERITWDGQSYPLAGARAHVESAGWRHTLVISGPGFEISGRAMNGGSSRLDSVRGAASAINTAAQAAEGTPSPARPVLKRPSIWVSPAENRRRRAAGEPDEAAAGEPDEEP